MIAWLKTLWLRIRGAPTYTVLVEVGNEEDGPDAVAEAIAALIKETQSR